MRSSSSRQSQQPDSQRGRAALFPDAPANPFQGGDAGDTPRDQISSMRSGTDRPHSEIQPHETPRADSKVEMAPQLFPKEESEGQVEQKDFFDTPLEEQRSYQQQQEEKDQLGLGLQDEDIQEDLNDTARSYDPLFLLQEPKLPRHKARRQKADRLDDYQLRDQVEQEAKRKREEIEEQREKVYEDKSKEKNYGKFQFDQLIQDDKIEIGEIDIDFLNAKRKELNNRMREEEYNLLRDFEQKRTKIYAEQRAIDEGLEMQKRTLKQQTRQKEANANRRKHEKTKTIKRRVGDAKEGLHDGIKRHQEWIHNTFGKEGFVPFPKRHEFVDDEKRKNMVRNKENLVNSKNTSSATQSDSPTAEMYQGQNPLRTLRDISESNVPFGWVQVRLSNLNAPCILKVTHPLIRAKKLFTQKRTQWEFFDGLPDSNDLVFDKAIYMNVPSNKHIRPSNLLLFELIWYRGNKGKVNDQVVGWGVFPLINSDFSLNEGRFKVPLLFGPVNYSIDKYFDIQKEMQKNLDSWLCNIYIEMHKLPPSLEQFTAEMTQMNKTLVQKAGEDVGRGGFDDRQFTRTQMAFDTGQQRDYSMLDNRIIRIKKIYYLLNIAQHQEMIQNNSDQIKLDDYTFAVSQKELYSRHNTLKKLRFIGDEAFSDISFYNARSSQFWISFLIFVLCLWLRMYLHYIGDFLMLKMLGETVSEFNPTPYYVQMSYSRDLGIWKLFGVMVFGPLFNTIIFTLIVFITFLFKCIYQRHKCKCQIPALLYKVFATFGIVIILDFILIFVVELFVMLGQSGKIVVKDNNSWVPDTFLLYYGYIEHRYTFVGILLTIFTYFTITSLNIILFCVYIISFHMNGRLRDIYNRLAGDQTKFFVPYDNEVSLQYLMCLRDQIENQYREAKRPKKVKKFITCTEGEVDRARIKKNEPPPVFVKLIKKKDNQYELARCFQKNPDGSILELNPKALDRHQITEDEMNRIFMVDEAPPEEGLLFDQPQRGHGASFTRDRGESEGGNSHLNESKGPAHGLDLLNEEDQEGGSDEEDVNEQSRLSVHNRPSAGDLRHSLLKKKMQ